MCWSCSPLCGSCRPPRRKAAQCPECGAYNVFDIEVREPRIERRCSKCNADLTDLATPKVVRCKRTGRLCANPCRQHVKPPADGNLVDCRYTTSPPGPSWVLEEESA